MLHFACSSTGQIRFHWSLSEFERTKTIQMLNGNLLCAANYPFLSPEIDFPTPPLMNATLSVFFFLVFFWQPALQSWTLKSAPSRGDAPAS